MADVLYPNQGSHTGEFSTALGNERQITFYSTNGHTHDGNNSTAVELPPASVTIDKLSPDTVTYLLSGRSGTGGGSGETLGTGTVSLPIGSIAAGGTYTNTASFTSSAIIIDTQISFSGGTNIKLEFFHTNDYAESDVEYSISNVTTGTDDNQVWAHQDRANSGNIYYKVTNTGTGTITGGSITVTAGNSSSPSDTPHVDSIGIVGDNEQPATGPIMFQAGVGVSILRSGNTFIWSTAPVNNPTGAPPPVPGVTDLAATTGIDSATGLPWITVTWSYPTQPGVNFELTLTQGSFGVVQTPTTTQDTYTFTGLIPNQSYTITVQVATSSSQYSSVGSITITTANVTTPPAIPTGITAYGSPDILFVNWTAVTSIPVAASYNIQVDSTNTFNSASLQNLSVTTSFGSIQNNVNGSQIFASGSTWYARVQSVGTTGLTSAWSAAVTGTNIPYVAAQSIGTALITTAMIQDAAITNAKIGTAAITDANIANLSATKIITGTLQSATIQLGASGIISASAAQGSGGYSTMTLDDNGLHYWANSTTQYGTDGTKLMDINFSLGTANFAGTLSATTLSGGFIDGGSIAIGGSSTPSSANFGVSSTGEVYLTTGNVFLNSSTFQFMYPGSTYPILQTTGNGGQNVELSLGGAISAAAGGWSWNETYEQYFFDNSQANSLTGYNFNTGIHMQTHPIWLGTGPNQLTQDYLAWNTNNSGPILAGANNVTIQSSNGYYLQITSAGDCHVNANFSSTNKYFRIPHPLAALKESKDLVYSSIEGPRADMIHRGQTRLANGTATVNVDNFYGMTAGTFEALAQDVQVWAYNTTGPEYVAASIDSAGNLTLTSSNATAVVNWMVVAERNDSFVHTNSSFVNGHLINEANKITIGV